MNPTARKLTALSLAAVMGLGLAACSGGSGNGDATGTASPTPGTTAEPTSYADQIVVGITAEPKYIEPNAPGMGPAEVQVSQQIFEGLVRTGDDGSIEPVLATDWTISDDGLTYTFNLVQGVKFSNGEDVEPSDWVWSFYRARDYETSNYRYIAEAIDTVEATDEQVVITLTEPNAAFLAELGCFNMVLGDQSYAESMSDEEYLKNPIGTGPYMLKDWTQGSSLTLEANPYYRVEGMPKTKEIKYVLIADDNTRLMQLQSGQIDQAKHLIINSSLVSSQAVRETADCIRVSSICALVIGKMMHAAELGIRLAVAPDSYCRQEDLLLPEEDYVTIVGNLLENAVEELSRGEHDLKEIRLALYCRPDCNVIVCEDTGGGVDPEIQPHIFEKGVSSKGEGRGLGLCLIHQLVEQHHGTIDVMTEAGAGTCFTLTFTDSVPEEA